MAVIDQAIMDFEKIFEIIVTRTCMYIAHGKGQTLNMVKTFIKK